jgi:hypothetical protein
VKNFLYALYELCVSCEVCTLGPTTEYRYTQSGNGLSGVHSIMKEKLAQLVRVGGARPPRYHHLQSCSVRFSWEGRYTPTISSLLLYVLCEPHNWNRTSSSLMGCGTLVTKVGTNSGTSGFRSVAISGQLSGSTFGRICGRKTKLSHFSRRTTIFHLNAKIITSSSRWLPGCQAIFCGVLMPKTNRFFSLSPPQLTIDILILSF